MTQQPRRRVKLLEALVLLVIVSVVARFVYYVVHWRDITQEIAALKPHEWAIAAAVVVLYYFLNRHDKSFKI